MYRVELKELQLRPAPLFLEVPNVPCGVESKEFSEGFGLFLREKFLMYRVELKVSCSSRAASLSLRP